MSSCQSLKLAFASHEAAKYAVEHWHYSKCMPKSKLVKIGVWEDEEFIGVVIFGSGANKDLFSPYGLNQTQGCELVRIALRRHCAPVSRIVRISFFFLKKACPGIRLIVSFADPEHGHVGGVYQAGGWIYAGKTTSSDEYIVNGKRWQGRALRMSRKGHANGGVSAPNVLAWAQRVLDPSAKLVKGSTKYRYLMPLDSELKSKLSKIALPYPKKVSRAGSIDVDASAHQAEEGGSTPTPALHLAEDTHAR